MAGIRTPLTTFTLFPELPYDIRYMIWMAARPGPRIVYLHSFYLKSFKCHRVWSDCRNNYRGNKRFFREDDHETDEHPIRNLRPWERTNIEPSEGFKSYEPSIPVLAACRESYHIFSQFYTRAFGCTAAFPETWFDFERDTLYLDIWYTSGERGYEWYLPKPRSRVETTYLPEDLGQDVDRVQNLAVNHLDIPSFDYHVWLETLLQQFKNAKKITFVESERYRGPEEVGLVLEDHEAPLLRDILWNGHKGNYNPIVDKFLNKQYEEELAEIAGRARDSPNAFTQAKRTWAMGEMPIIEQKIAVFGRVIDAFDEDEKKYQRQKEEYRMVINMRSPGKKTLRLSLKETTVVKEIVAMSRKGWNLPEKKTCKGIFDEHHMEIGIESLVCHVVWKDSHTWEIRFQ